jgi:hypothetical protein
MSQDAIERRATALQSATAQVDDPAEEAVLGRVRTLLSHPAVWAPVPDFAMPTLAADAVDLAPAPAPEPAPVPRPARRPWHERWTIRRWVLALGGAVTAAAAVVAAISLAPDRVTTRFDLTGTPQTAEAHASVTATRLDAGWHVTLSIQDLPPAGPNDYYQGWAVRDDGVHVPLGTFHMRQPGDVELWSGVDLRGFARLEITRQQVGGSQDPGEPVLEGAIPTG